MTEALSQSPPIQKAHWAARLGICLLATAIVTGISLWIALQHKRLLNYPYYDDVSYFVDGWEKLQALKTGGLRGFERACTMPPPHSPFSTALAMASFAVFGRHEWAPYHGGGTVTPEWGPYVANGAIVLFLFVFADLLLGPFVPIWQRAVLLLFISVSRLPSDIIWNFKPNAFWGIVTAAAVIVALRKPTTGWSRPLLSGLLFGCAFLAKPSISPVTGVVMALTVICAALATQGGRKRAVMLWTICPVVAVVACLPYLAVGGGTVTYYYIFKDVLSETRERWIYKGTPAQHAVYFITGPGGWQIIGPSIWVFISLLAIGLVRFAARWRRLQPGTRFRFIGLALAGLAAFAIPTIEPVKDQRLAMAFHALLVFGAVLVLAEMLRSQSRRSIGLLITCAAAAIVLAIIPFRDPRRREYWLTANDSEIIGLNQLAERVYSDLQAVKVSGGAPTDVLLGVMDKAVNDGTLKWMYLGDTHPLNILTLPHWGDEASEASAIAVTHVFVTADPGDAGPDPTDLIGPQTEKRLFGLFGQRKDFRLVDSFRAFNGKTYCIFQRVGI